MNPSAIFTADWHLRETPPAFRSGENFWGIQWKKVRTISQLQARFNCPVFHAGDLFHHWKASPFLLSMTIKNLPAQFFTVYGNHDLPQHNINLAGKSAIGTLEACEALTVLPGNHFGDKEPQTSIVIEGRKVMVWHVYNSLSKPFWANESTWMAKRMAEAFSDQDVILTGDNHTPFVYSESPTLVVNPGPITRQATDMVSIHPRVYLWYAATNTVEAVKLPLNPLPLDTRNIAENRERNIRMEAFVDKLNKEWEVNVDFQENLKRFYSANKIEPEISQLIQSAIEEE